MRDENTQTNERTSDAGPPVLLTVPEACEKLRISKTMLYDLLRSHQLESVQIGRRRLISARAIDTYVQRRTREAID
jgi:excisionase family DNA binding protein